MLGGAGVARRGVRVPPAAIRASWATGQLPWPAPAYTERCPPQFDRLTLVGANVGVTATPRGIERCQPWPDRRPLAITRCLLLRVPTGPDRAEANRLKVAAQNEVVVKETAMVGHESTATTPQPVPRALPESTNKLQTPPALSFPIQFNSIGKFCHATALKRIRKQTANISHPS